MTPTKSISCVIWVLYFYDKLVDGLEANKALVQAELVEETGKVITRKDLTNTAYQAKTDMSRNSLTTAVDTLKHKYSKVSKHDIC